MEPDEKLWSICVDIYREAFKKSKPSLDFDKVLLKAEAKKLKDNWFMKYYLPDKTLEAIINKHCAKHKLKPRDAHRVSAEIVLGCAPTGVEPKKRIRSGD
jgi:hypothetical protein